MYEKKKKIMKKEDLKHSLEGRSLLEDVVFTGLILYSGHDIKILCRRPCSDPLRPNLRWEYYFSPIDPLSPLDPSQVHRHFSTSPVTAFDIITKIICQCNSDFTRLDCLFDLIDGTEVVGNCGLVSLQINEDSTITLKL